MIKTLCLEKFKSFNKLEELKIKNLTIIAGKNSCGKSSIIQSLLLLKQTLNSDSDTPLATEGNYLKYTNLKEISHGLPSINSAQIGYKFGLSSGGEIEISFKNRKTNGNYEAHIEKFTTSSSKIKKVKFHKISNREIKSLHKISDFISSQGVPSNSRTIFNRFMPEWLELTFNTEGTQKNFRLPLFFLYDDHTSINQELKESIKNILYLSPVRATPERAYVHYSNNVNELNEDGSNSAHLLWAKQNKEVLWRGKNLRLIEAIDECIRCTGLEQTISPDRIGEIIYKIGVSEGKSGGKVSLADVGFGYSQVIPVMLIGLLNTPKNLTLIEQPEIHLHPSSAANLADLFLGLIEDNRQFIIETHSQELINRLRLRVIENPELSKKINIVFVESDTKNGSTIKQFEIDENGMFPQWPNGFLDESEKIAQAMLNARLEARKTKRNLNTDSPQK